MSTLQSRGVVGIKKITAYSTSLAKNQVPIKYKVKQRLNYLISTCSQNRQTQIHLCTNNKLNLHPPMIYIADIRHC